jgi:AcrR family transcriptional regulator
MGASRNGGRAKATASPAGRRREREREKRYQSILDAAETLFAREGYAKAGMEQIADMAELSVGSLYFYFKNKEDLLAHLLGQIGYKLRKFLGTEFEKKGATLEGFRYAGYRFFEEFCPQHPGQVAILFRESVGKGSAVEERRRDIFDRMTADVRQALTRSCGHAGHTFKSGFSAEVIALSVMGIYERVAYKYLLCQENPDDLKVIGRDAVDFIVGGIENLFSEA